MKKQKRLSRRQFLGTSAGLAAGGLLSRMPGLKALAPGLADVDLTMWHGWTGADNTEELHKVIDMFNEENEFGIFVEPTGLGWDDFFSKWVVSAAAGSAPDIALYHSSELPEYAWRGITVPIESYINVLGFDFEGISEVILEACKWEGEYYAVPGDVHPLGMYYNTDLAEAAGLDPSSPPTTADELLDWAYALTIRDDDGVVSQYGISIPLTGAIPRWLWFSLLYQFGGTFLNEDGTAAVNSEASKQALQFMVDLVFEHEVASGGGEGDVFATEQVAIEFVGPWMVNLRMSQEINFMTAPLPVVGDKPAAWANTHILSLSKQSSDEKYEPAMQFNKWFFENYAIPAKTVGIVPLSPASLNSPEFVEDERYKYYEAFVETAEFAVLEPSIPQYTAIFSFGKPTALVTNIEAALAGDKTVDEALEDMKEGIDEELSRPLD